MLFLSHWGHVSLIFIWLSGNIFHVGWTGNFDLWKQNPLKVIPIAHSVFDPHFGSSDVESNVAYSGLYNVLFTIGFTNVKDIYNFTILTE
jgi:photosystem I P700 chlorophyll a apoprotein A2